MASQINAGATDTPVKKFCRRNLAVITALSFITLISIWYGDSITNKFKTQVSNVGQWQFIYPSEIQEQEIIKVITEVQSVTGDNPNVYFVSKEDFLLDYYAGYAPAGYYNPLTSWISRDEFNNFLQGLVDNGYYLVIDKGFIHTVLPYIKINHHQMIGMQLIVWK
ncbi:MAG: hypothetical protein R8K20_04665 [Gallionellaceae bacterium]